MTHEAWTRALSDFAKIVEILDARGASFVSVTQAFNTTSSMGRLTLNVLLSFAQFEREVTGERIRDKIAASKKKGLWMGGPVPLGYEVKERKLVVNDTEAELVRHIYRRYLALGSVRELVDELDLDGHRTKVQHCTSGPHKGGCRFRRGTLYHMLSNRIYLGEIVHKGQAHPGEHQPILSEELWQTVQERLAERGPGAIANPRTPRRSLLAGIIYDGLGRAMTPSHASKGSRRYRYYVTRQPTSAAPAWRIPGHDIEQIVIERIRGFLLDENHIARLAALADPAQIEPAVAAAVKLADDPKLLMVAPQFGLQRVDVEEESLKIRIGEERLLQALGMAVADDRKNVITLATQIGKVRRGHEIKLVIQGAGWEAPVERDRDTRLATLVTEALELRDIILARPGEPLHQIAKQLGKCRKHIGQILPLAWLAPNILEAIAQGHHPAGLNRKRLLAIELPMRWDRQNIALGFE
ncbi:MAG: hypothetical protein DI623_05730 [Sphingomonas sanxanigenens]|uniref:Recombinase family protein n=1 Tax=Sphingomonas sanxanigenens TaxID=397260 RepID=A0A2W5C6N9_9SPHN|nr:MAG: hypothetical protein DI623_05730 [Sphingomonas sanxanigenens]